MAVSTVTWEELEDSPEFEADRNGDLRGTRRFVVGWSDSVTFAGELLSDADTGLPQVFPTISGLYVERVTIAPFEPNPSGGAFTNPATQMSAHTYALVTATYSPIILDSEFESPTFNDPSLPDGTIATYRRADSIEAMTLPGRSFKWDSDNKQCAEDANPVIVVPIVDHVVTWSRVSSPPWTSISKLKGRVNASEFRIPATGQRLAAQTLLFLGAVSEINYKLDGTIEYNLEYTFQERSIQNLNSTAEGAVRVEPEGTDTTDTVIGWNHLWRTDDAPKWDIPEDTANNRRMYETGDFSSLFTFQAF